MKYSFTYPYKDTNTKDELLIVDVTGTKYPQLSYILGYKDSSNDEELLYHVEGVLMGNPKGIHVQVINDFEADIRSDYTKIINSNFDNEENHTDTIATLDLRDLLNEIIKLKKSKKST